MTAALLYSPHLSHRQCQLVTLFVYLAERAGEGATWRDMGSRLSLAHDGASLRSLVKTLAAYKLVFTRRRINAPRSPRYFYAHREAWQK